MTSKQQRNPVQNIRQDLDPVGAPLQIRLGVAVDGIQRVLTLDRVCSGCNGQGGHPTGAKFPEPDFALCETCDGIGFRMLPAGRILKAFIQRHIQPDELGV